MKTFATTLLALCMSASLLNAQETKSYEIVERKIVNNNLPEGWAELIDNNGYTVGSFRMFREKGKYWLEVKPDGKRKFTVGCFQGIIAVPSADRLIVYSDVCGKEMNFIQYLSIYTMKGKKIKDVGLICGFPYCVTVADNGDIAFAGLKKDNEKRIGTILYKFDKDGNKLWEKFYEEISPQHIFISPDSKYISLTYRDKKIGDIRCLTFFNETGDTIFTEKNTYISNVAFFKDSKPLICGWNEWRILDDKNNFSIIHEGKYNGSPEVDYPLIIHPSGQQFSIALEGEKSLNTYSVSTGKLIATQKFDKRIHSDYAKRAVMISDDNTVKIKFSGSSRNEKEFVTLKLNNYEDK